MSCQTTFRCLVGLALLTLCGSDAALAKLAFRTDDVYVRRADLIVVGDAISLRDLDGVRVAVVVPSAILLGEDPGGAIHVLSFEHTDEDMPVFTIGRKALLFLVGPRGPRGIYSCVGAEAGKREYAPARDRHWAKQLDRVVRLVEARRRPSDDERMASLVALLDSSDIALAAAASNYLNYLVNDEENEEWAVSPPAGSSNWSWDDYFLRNVAAHRRAWKRWWSTRARSGH